MSVRPSARKPAAKSRRPLIVNLAKPDDDRADIRAKLHRAILAVQEQVPVLVRDVVNEFGGYEYVPIDKYYQIIIPIARRQRLTWVPHLLNPRPHPVDRELTVTDVEVTLWHNGHEFQAYLRFPLASRDVATQDSGATLSYADKYTMRMLFKIPTGEGDADKFDNRRPRRGVDPTRYDRDPPASRHTVTAPRPPRDHPPAYVMAEPPAYLDEVPPPTSAEPPMARIVRRATPSAGASDALYAKLARAVATADRPALRRIWDAEKTALDALRQADAVEFERISKLFEERMKQLSAAQSEGPTATATTATATRDWPYEVAPHQPVRRRRL